jgi:hypothetical protein
MPPGAFILEQIKYSRRPGLLFLAKERNIGKH